MKKVGVVVFPGSNCDYDVYHVVKKILNLNAEYIWHKDTSLRDYDAIVLPGGFSYGDNLRAGAIARFSPVMQEIVKYAKAGKPLIGICNGFQVLVEAGLLPGALITNTGLRFRCEDVYLKVANQNTMFTRDYTPGQVIKMPIAHYTGNYFATDDVLKTLQDNDSIIFQYCDANGELTDDANPNGSLLNIAGIMNREKNVLGMMPHPERACEMILGSTDGLGVFTSILGGK
ncbi:MAG: phosphoribosylformylglycinamidine synthase subunit PurQ [Candidatus Marinimicrobia bacterium]|nr:phosphoribosylformylglycinamidine synthase subunit PurQ [Candidatus Neomarinimicrobiota bacterium]